jgi:BirA family transcriptional regulator, biotin operon repressor / biotin---[acetyl-CoA-carboxylase] ligase
MILPNHVIELTQTGSTQDDARRAGFGIFWTANQTKGKGRYEREWFCEPGGALAVSICFESYRHHIRPYLVGMAVAIAVAEEFDLQVQWPNDLVLNGKKVAGILTEVFEGLIVVGLGLNLNCCEFPEDIEVRATSLVKEGREPVEPISALERVLGAIRQFDPAPADWEDIKDRWAVRDMTAGKSFTLTDGRIGKAVGVNEIGALIWSDGKITETVTVGEALWG